jgi:hypothetical protein
VIFNSLAETKSTKKQHTKSDEQRKAREIAKKEQRKQRKQLRSIMEVGKIFSYHSSLGFLMIFQSNNYFLDHQPNELEIALQEAKLEKLFASLAPDELQMLIGQLEERVNEKIIANLLHEKLRSLEVSVSKVDLESEEPPMQPHIDWGDRELELLIEAVKLFPSGTRDRYDGEHCHFILS